MAFLPPITVSSVGSNRMVFDDSSSGCLTQCPAGLHLRSAIFLDNVFVRVYVLQPYNKTAVNNLVLHIFCILLQADQAYAFRILMSRFWVINIASQVFELYRNLILSSSWVKVVISVFRTLRCRSIVVFKTEQDLLGVIAIFRWKIRTNLPWATALVLLQKR